jgi:hypothetical protein
MTSVDQQIAQLSKCDVSLCGVAWIEDGRDVVLRLLLPPADRETKLVCRWARELRIDLQFESNTGGYPLSWDGEIGRREDGSWTIAFDFAGHGSLSLVCDELEYELSPLEHP